MGIFEKEEKRKKREAEEAQKKLEGEASQCFQELAPILKKYNFELGARLEFARNGLMARPELVRPTPKDQGQATMAPNNLKDFSKLKAS